MLSKLDDAEKFKSWCLANVEQVPLDEARKVPFFAVAARAYTVWWSLSPGYIPSRQQLNADEFGATVLPLLTLIDVIDDGRDYRWRLCGEQVAHVIGTQPVGRTLSDIESKLGDVFYFRIALEWVFKYREPFFYVLRHRTLAGCPKRSYGVLLPLTDAADADAAGDRDVPVRHVLGACDWVNDT